LSDERRFQARHKAGSRVQVIRREKTLSEMKWGHLRKRDRTIITSTWAQAFTEVYGAWSIKSLFMTCLWGVIDMNIVKKIMTCLTQL
jgi:hypothetical protein